MRRCSAAARVGCPPGYIARRCNATASSTRKSVSSLDSVGAVSAGGRAIGERSASVKERWRSGSGREVSYLRTRDDRRQALRGPTPWAACRDHLVTDDSESQKAFIGGTTREGPC